MKTQLLEDIGESAALSPLSSKPAGNSNAGKGVPDPAPARTAPPTRARAATGVWRHRIAAEPPVRTIPPPDEATPLELDKVFGELAALEAQFVRPEPQPALAAAPAEYADQPDIAFAEATPAAETTPNVTAPQDPYFDFTPPAPAPHLADPFTPPPAGLAQSGKRPLVWAACALSAALLACGGWYLVQERSDGGSPALVAGSSKAEPGAGAPVPSAVPAPASLPDVPPLVMLEPDPPAVIKPEPVPKPVVAKRAPVTAPKAVQAARQAARQAAASPLQKPAIRKTRERSAAPPTPPKERRRREPVRQLARASAVETERPSTPDTSMAATLKACRAHGYHAAQCIKRQCSVGTYGFACRGR